MEVYDCYSSFKNDIVQFAVVWLQEKFEIQTGGKVKVEIMYEQYIRYCAQGLIEPKKRSSFGKIVRQAFPTVKKRRLGPAGEQTSHYVGVVAKILLPPAPPPTDYLKVEPPAVVEVFAPQETASDATFACDHRRLSIDWTQSFPSYAFFYANLLTREEEDC